MLQPAHDALAAAAAVFLILLALLVLVFLTLLAGRALHRRSLGWPATRATQFNPQHQAIVSTRVAWKRASRREELAAQAAGRTHCHNNVEAPGMRACVSAARGYSALNSAHPQCMHSGSQYQCCYEVNVATESPTDRPTQACSSNLA